MGQDDEMPLTGIDIELRTLLELAAKAQRGTSIYVAPSRIERGLWRPDEDDGDSRRLQVAVGINLWTDPAAVCMAEALKYMLPRVSVPSKPDPYAAARMAVLLCAAQVGRAMP